MTSYIALFEEATDILSGYKRVRTFDKDITKYFYKNYGATGADDLLFIQDESINSLTSFAKALEEHDILYVESEAGPVEGFEPLNGITTLEEYFSWISNLGQINRKYTVLPLDEDYFEINANTRAINIPASFKKNGIAVQGDDLAEVVYFKVDRYFDYKDLNTADIYIQWETPKDANGNVTKSVSEAYIRDIESEPGKLIFGWPISEAITKTPGNLKFSVRFFVWEDADEAKSGTNKNLVYSLSTLSALIPIQPSIDLDIEAIDGLYIDDVGQRLIERLENSEIAGGYAAASPIFATNLSENEYDLGFNETNTLMVHAYSADTGAISYVWKKQGLNADNETEGEPITTSIVESKMERISPEIERDEDGDIIVDMTKWNLITKEKYPYTLYRKLSVKDGETAKFTPYRGKLAPDFDVDDIRKGLELYTKYSVFTVPTENTCGVYWAVAENRITNSSTSAASIKAKFPRPNHIVITEQPAARAVLNGEGTDVSCKLSVVAEETEHNVKSYAWYKSKTAKGWAENISLEDEDYELIADATEKEFTAKEPGYYKVIINNSRNGDTKTLFSERSRVTRPAQVPQLLEKEYSALYYNTDELTDENCPFVEMDSTVESDNYSVQWFIWFGEGDVKPITSVISLDPGVTKASFNPKNYEDYIKSISEDNDIDGNYYVIVTNHVNGSEASTAVPTDDAMFKIL